MKIFRRIMLGIMTTIVLGIGTFVLINFFLVKSEERFVNNLEFENSEIHVSNLEEFEKLVDDTLIYGNINFYKRTKDVDKDELRLYIKDKFQLNYSNGYALKTKIEGFDDLYYGSKKIMEITMKRSIYQFFKVEDLYYNDYTKSNDLNQTLNRKDKFKSEFEFKASLKSNIYSTFSYPNYYLFNKMNNFKTYQSVIGEGKNFTKDESSGIMTMTVNDVLYETNGRTYLKVGNEEFKFNVKSLQGELMNIMISLELKTFKNKYYQNFISYYNDVLEKNLKNYLA